MPGAAGPFLPNPIGFPPLVLCPSPSHAVSPMIPTEMLLSVPIPSVALHPQDDPFAWAPHSSACRRTASDTDWNLSHFCYPPPPQTTLPSSDVLRNLQPCLKVCKIQNNQKLSWEGLQNGCVLVSLLCRACQDVGGVTANTSIPRGQGDLGMGIDPQRADVGTGCSPHASCYLRNHVFLPAASVGFPPIPISLFVQHAEKPPKTASGLLACSCRGSSVGTDCKIMWTLQNL